MRSAMDLFDFEKSANLKHPTVHTWEGPERDRDISSHFHSWSGNLVFSLKAVALEKDHEKLYHVGKKFALSSSSFLEPIIEIPVCSFWNPPVNTFLGHHTLVSPPIFRSLLVLVLASAAEHVVAIFARPACCDHLVYPDRPGRRRCFVRASAV